MYVLEQAAEYLRTFKLSMGDAVGICTNQEVTLKARLGPRPQSASRERMLLFIGTEVGYDSHLCALLLYCRGSAPMQLCLSVLCAPAGTCFGADLGARLNKVCRSPAH